MIIWGRHALRRKSAADDNAPCGKLGMGENHGEGVEADEIALGSNYVIQSLG